MDILVLLWFTTGLCIISVVFLLFFNNRLDKMLDILSRNNSEISEKHFQIDELIYNPTKTKAFTVRPDTTCIYQYNHVNGEYKYNDVFMCLDTINNSPLYKLKFVYDGTLLIATDKNDYQYKVLLEKPYNLTSAKQVLN